MIKTYLALLVALPFLTHAMEEGNEEPTHTLWDFKKQNKERMERFKARGNQNRFPEVIQKAEELKQVINQTHDTLQTVEEQAIILDERSQKVQEKILTLMEMKLELEKLKKIHAESLKVVEENKGVLDLLEQKIQETNEQQISDNEENKATSATFTP